MMGSLDEIVRKLAKRARRHPKSLLTWFDDAGAIKIDDHYIVVKVDGFASSRALYPWCSYRDFGFRGVSGAVSDVIAKGCRPYVYAVSIGVKPGNVGYVEDIMKGVEEAVNLYGGYVENVDTNVGYDDWIDVFVVGECRLQPVPRYARVLDRIVLPRRIGLSVIGYIEYIKKSTPTIEEVREFTCRPKPCIDIVDIVDGCRTCIEGSIDISDTLAEALQQLGEVSNAGFYLYEEPSRILHPLAIEYSRREKIDLQITVLASNEEYIPLLIIKPSCEDEIIQQLRSIGLEPVAIGVTTTQQNITWTGKSIPKIVWNYISGSITM